VCSFAFDTLEPTNVERKSRSRVGESFHEYRGSGLGLGKLGLGSGFHAFQAWCIGFGSSGVRVQGLGSGLLLGLGVL